jgi:tetratricopeptide (TPR) repeat protein
MGELEYIFNHALVQEVAYRSIFLTRLKDRHLKVGSIHRKDIPHRLHEFYGMLAYHYSRCETSEQGRGVSDQGRRRKLSNHQRRMKRSTTYQEALGIYLSKYGPAADPEKLAIFHKNIAIALHNKGQYTEAVEYLDKALAYYWGKLPKQPISQVFNFLSGLLYLISSLYLPYLMFRRIPTPTENEAVNLFFKKLEVWSIIDPKRYFIDSIHFYRRIIKFDLTKCEFGIGMFVGASNLFSFTGISFGLSKRILELVRHRILNDDIKSFTLYEFSETMHNYMAGNWNSIQDYDDSLVEKNLGIGEVHWASLHLFWHGLTKLYQGCFDTAKVSVDRLKDISKLYANDFSAMLKQLLNSSLLMECRKLHEALGEIEEGIAFGRETHQGLALIHMLSCKARIVLLMGDIEEARKAIEHANQIRHEVSSAVPWQLCNFYRSRFEYDLYRLEESTRRGNKAEASEYRKKAVKSGHAMAKNAQKVAQHRTEAYKLRGVYFWIVNKHKKAMEWWNRAINEGASLGARIELSRTYFEMGKRLLGVTTGDKTLDKVNAQEYLVKARQLFAEMGLDSDLDNLDRIAGPLEN